MTFLDLRAKKLPLSQAKAVILPIPFGGITSQANLLSQGPEAILQASQLLSTYDVETNTDLDSLGLLTAPMVPCPKDGSAVEVIRKQAAEYFAKQKLVAAIGGSNLTSLGMVQAALPSYSKLSVVHLGAHPHMAQRSDPLDEAGVMFQLQDKCPVSHLGIRTMSKAEHPRVNPDHLVFARDLYNNGLNAAMDAIDLLSDRVYVAIHLDVLDPACMPSVPRPEPGGLDWYAVNNLIRMIAREKSIIGFDVTGLLPSTESLHTHLLAAKLVYKTLICCLQNTY